MRLSRDEIDLRLRECPGWTLEGEAVSRTIALPSFADAIAFVTRLALEAEAADHHPDLHINYRRVTVRWSTHSAGGVTEKDFAGVKQTDTLVARFIA
jgi:4a-hydroxytetrahydrobiopterin dehydratase